MNSVFRSVSTSGEVRKLRNEGSSSSRCRIEATPAAIFWVRPASMEASKSALAYLWATLVVRIG